MPISITRSVGGHQWPPQPSAAAGPPPGPNRLVERGGDFAARSTTALTDLPDGQGGLLAVRA
jgi:hypothetical protein